MLNRLEARYCPPGWATIRECSDRTGYRNRTADLIALGIWPSRGLEIIGFEVKSFRGLGGQFQIDLVDTDRRPAKGFLIRAFAGDNRFRFVKAVMYHVR